MRNESGTVLVTGAAGGVGRELVSRLTDLGWRVYAGIRPGSCAAGLTGVPVELDITDLASVDSARRIIESAVGEDGLTALVNNAGLSVDGPLELIPVARLRQQFEVNVIGQIAVAQAFLPLLRCAGGRIVNIGGAAGSVTLPMLGALSASKAALDSANDALRMEVAPHGVTVSYVEPGALSTQLFVKSAGVIQRDGFTGSPTEHALYAPDLARAMEAMSRQKPAPVGLAVDAVVHALTARRPKARYRVGREARFLLPVLARLPVPLRDRLIRDSIGLNRRDQAPVA
ncbi:SDR family NAD(P)-dependent oxidoreductase [Pseudonocardia spinosispora]|uniref:SDR family NAD(P)-dependent oxidoreductase n=1 Tax=Pseudonocardia spinosispora TaxID=103441 RepID=UPI0005622617|nr:SDR family NAD(P)-dependent oxidoreductase [Pseudonocardia spinosispora]